MVCPNCKNNFYYLKGKKFNIDNGRYYFSCPKCAKRLSFEAREGFIPGLKAAVVGLGLIPVLIQFIPQRLNTYIDLHLTSAAYAIGLFSIAELFVFIIPFLYYLNKAEPSQDYQEPPIKINRGRTIILALILITLISITIYLASYRK
jgi:hypothetical protein